MEDVKCTLVLYFNDMTTLKRVPTLLEQTASYLPIFCHHFLAFIFSLFFTARTRGPSSPAAKKQKKKKELKKLG